MPYAQKKKKEKPHCIFKPQSLNMDISVSEIPFQLRIWIAVFWILYSRLHIHWNKSLTSWSYNSYCWATSPILWANIDTSWFFGPSREHVWLLVSRRLSWSNATVVDSYLTGCDARQVHICFHFAKKKIIHCADKTTQS